MKKLLTISLAALYLIGLPLSVSAQTTPTGSGTRPARLYYSPGTGTVTVNASNQFSTAVVVNTGGEYSSGADVIVTFNTSELEFISGSYATGFYPSQAVSMSSPSMANSTGRIMMAPVILAPATGESPVYKNGTGTIANLTFESKISVGSTTTLNFDFTLGSTTDTNVAGFDTNGDPADILGEVTSATYTIAVASVGDDPSIDSINPTSGQANTDVIMHIYGSNFDTATGSVYIGTRSASITSWADTEIVIVVPQVTITSDSGPHQVKIKRADSKEATYDGYIYLVPVVSNNPYITSIVPNEGEKGTDVIVDIYGQNFGSAQGNISMSSLSSSIISWSDNKVVVKAYCSSVNISNDKLYPVTLTRTDGKSNTYHGFMVRTGIGFIPLFGGLILFNGAAAYLVKRKWFTA